MLIYNVVRKIVLSGESTKNKINVEDNIVNEISSSEDAGEDENDEENEDDEHQDIDLVRIKQLCID